MDYDAFICHASEDKDDFVRPLAQALKSRGIKVFYDEFSLSVGDSLRRAIDEALGKSKFGIVILSRAFFAKPWAARELDGLVQRQVNDGCVILPIWHGVEEEEVRKFSAPLANTLALSSSMGVDAVVDKLVAKINGEPKSALAVLKPTTSNNALREFTKRFHDERLAQVEAGDAPVELGGGARVIVHIVPLGAVSEFLNLSAQQMAEGHRVWPLDSGVHGHFTSQWGLVNYGTQLDRINEQTYAVVGSDGTIEAVDLDLLADKRGRTMVLNNFYIEDKLVEFIFNAEQFYKQVKVDPPFGVCISLTRVRGYEGHRVALDGSHPLKSDDIHLPSAIIPAFSEAQPEVGDHLKRQFDKLANAAGWNASQSYASDGTWHSRLGL